MIHWKNYKTRLLNILVKKIYPEHNQVSPIYYHLPDTEHKKETNNTTMGINLEKHKIQFPQQILYFTERDTERARQREILKNRLYCPGWYGSVG